MGVVISVNIKIFVLPRLIRACGLVVYVSAGTYARLVCEIQFVRSLGFYLIQIYIPSGLITVISWVSFWLHRNASPARVALGVTTVLTMTTLMSSTNAALPKISYIKSIDVYLGTCFVMVFAALVGKDHVTTTKNSQRSLPFFFSCFLSPVSLFPLRFTSVSRQGGE